MAFHVGQLVACINDDCDAFTVSGRRYRPGLDGLKKGLIYTVSRHYFDEDDGIWEVVLAEIKRPNEPPGFAADRFRPIQPTSIEIFTAMLAPKETEKA